MKVAFLATAETKRNICVRNVCATICFGKELFFRRIAALVSEVYFIAYALAFLVPKGRFSTTPVLLPVYYPAFVRIAQPELSTSRKIDDENKGSAERKRMRVRSAVLSELASLVHTRAKRRAVFNLCCRRSFGSEKRAFHFAHSLGNKKRTGCAHD